MLGEVLVVLAAFFWAVGASFYGESLRNIDPIKLNLIRSSAAAVFLFFVAFFFNRLSYFLALDPMMFSILLAASVLGWAVGDTLYFVSLKFIGVSKTAPLTYAYPLFIIPLSSFFLREKLTPGILAGTAAILSAVWLISRSKEEDVKSVRMKLGIAAALLAALFWAIDAVIFKFVMRELDPVFIAFFKIIAIMPFLLAYSALTRKNSELKRLERRDVILAAIGGVFGVGVGDMSYLMGLSLTQANIAGPLAATTPMFAGILAAVFLKEKITLNVFLAMLLATVGAGLLMG